MFNSVPFRVFVAVTIAILTGGCVVRSNQKYNWDIPANGTKGFSVCGSGYEVIVTNKGEGKLEVVASNKDETVRATITPNHPIPVYSTKQPGKARFVLRAIENGTRIELEVINARSVEVLEESSGEATSRPD